MFITFEGGEGTGKSTLIKIISKKLKIKGYNVTQTREPGGLGSTLSEEIRKLVLSPEFKNVNKYTESLLYAASRAQHLDDVIIPAIKKGDIVLCDRYLDSSMAYQAYARNLGEKFVKNINEYALKVIPDITFYIDLDPLIGIKRIALRDKFDRLDMEKITFHDDVRKAYLKMAHENKKRIFIIDGNLTISQIAEIMIKKIIDKYEEGN